MFTILQDALDIIKRHRGAYIFLNVAFYGTVLLCMAVTVAKPELQWLYQSSTEQGYAQPGLFRSVTDAYANRHLFTAVTMTFLVNLMVAAIAMSTLPSLVIPFAGVFVQLYRAFLWGIMFAPVGPLRFTLIPHSLTLIVEGQAYILCALACYVHARQFLWPQHYGMRSREAGYLKGAASTLKLYVPITGLLLAAAIYEVIESVYLMPALVRH